MKIEFNGSSTFPRWLLLFFLILRLSPSIWSQQNDTEAILAKVAGHLARKEYSLALELFDKLPPERQETTDILIMRATILNAAGRTADAKKIANAIVAADAKNTQALMILADAAAIEGKEKDRRAFLDKVIATEPNNVRALNDLANINIKNQNLRVASNYFDKVLSVEPDNGEALVGRAVIYRYTREPKSAERLLNRAATIYKDWARPLHERARLYKSAGFNNDALEDLKAALAIEPDNYMVLVDCGELLMEMNQKQEALKYLNKAIEIEPDVFMAYIYSAAIKDELRDYAGAEKDYSVLVTLKSDYYFGFEALGVLKMRNKQWAAARDAFLAAYKQAPKEYSYALLAAINWMRAGRQTDPKQFLAQVLRTVPRDTTEYAVIRLYHDLSGDSSVVTLVENEKNFYTKSQMLFYLASFYDIRGNKTLADKYYLMVKNLNSVGSVEWQLNEMMIAERGLGVKADK
ncbi:tetratricopeptide repeat protein [Treponema sp. R6D11]